MRHIRITQLIIGIVMLIGMTGLVLSDDTYTIVYNQYQQKIFAKQQQHARKQALEKREQCINHHISILYPNLVEHQQRDWWAENIASASYKYNIPAEIVLIAIKVESHFDVTAESIADGQGSMQVRKFWQGNQPYDIYDPVGNIYAGTYILTKYYHSCGQDWKCAFATYNVGPSNYKKKESAAAKQRYLNKIYSELNKITTRTNDLTCL